MTTDDLDILATLEFWRTTLAGSECSPYPTLPPFIDRPESDQDVEYQFPQPRELPFGISTSTLVRAAWGLIAGSLTESDDVVFGSAGSGGVEINPVRVKPDVNQSIQGYLREVQQQGNQALSYRRVGLDEIAEVSVDCQKACAFQTVLVESQSQSQSQPQPQGESLSTQLKRYGLMIQIELAPAGDNINTKASLDSRIIEPLLAFRLLRRLEYVMQQLATATPGKMLNELHTIPPLDLDQIREWNCGVPPVVERCIHDIIQERIQADPEAQAVCAWDGELTYRELDDLSSQVAAHLVYLGVGPEKVVPLCFEKSMWTVVAILSVLRAGGTFILLDPGLPESRIKSIIEKVDAKTAITSQLCQPRLSQFVHETVVLSREAMQSLKSQSQQAPVKMPTVAPSNSAYIIFTSGSTGEPKGCVIEHRSYCSAAFGHGKTLGFSNETRALQFGSYNFAGAIMEMVMTMIYGGCICIPSDEDRTANLAGAMSKLKANWAFLTSTVLALLHPENVPSLRTLCIGGEPIRSSQIREWAQKVRLRQTYGSAETAAVVSSAALDSSSVVTSVGKATTCRCWLTSPTNTNELVPIGAPGEVVFEGPVIGRHYIGNPQKTAEAFIKIPSWRAALGPVAASSRFYRTGDIATYRSDGSIELLGRKDTQVKLRGQRIELGEIEHQARQSSPDLQEVAVELAVLGGGPKLVGFLVIKPRDVNGGGNGITLNERVKSVIRTVKSRLETVLPHYMVPSVFLPIPNLPLTPSGKTDRRTLRQMSSALTEQQILDLQGNPEESKRQPSTQAEKQLQTIWAKVLQIDPATISADVSFFHIGGDSASAMRVVREARALGFNLDLANVFRQETIAELARQQALNAEEAPEEHESAILVEPSVKAILLEELESELGISSTVVADIYPLTFVQEILVAGNIASGHMADYFYLDLDASLDVSDLRHDCMRALERFPILRARFLQLQSKWWQVVPQQPIDTFSVYNVAGNLEEYFEDFYTKNVKSLLPTQPPAAFFLFIHENGMRLTVRWSHAQYDAFSAPLLLQSIFDGAQDQDRGEIASPAKPSFPMYLSYAAHQRPKSLAYWSRLLKGSHLTLIGPHIRLGNTPNGKPEPVYSVSEARVPRRASKFTHATLIRAAWAILLSTTTNEKDVTYGNVVAGRNAAIPAVEKIVGCCLNILPERIDFSILTSITDLLNTIQDQYLSTGDADSLDFKDIVEHCTTWPAGSSFDAVLHHRNVDEEAAIHTPAGISRMNIFKNPLNLPFVFVVSASRGENVAIEVLGDTHMLEALMAQTLGGGLVRIVERLGSGVGMDMGLEEFMGDVKSIIY